MLKCEHLLVFLIFWWTTYWYLMDQISNQWEFSLFFFFLFGNYIWNQNMIFFFFALVNNRHSVSAVSWNNNNWRFLFCGGVWWVCSFCFSAADRVTAETGSCESANAASFIGNFIHSSSSLKSLCDGKQTITYSLAPG